MARTTPGVAAGNVRDSKLPGSSLLDAIYNRRLMSWSDRGGASMLLGRCWAEQCAIHLAGAVGLPHPIPGDRPHELRGVIRLDDNPAVEREANLNQLENPDFLLIGVGSDGRSIVQAADAKFAADRIKVSQVSVAALDDLLRVPATGVTRTMLAEAIAALGLEEAAVQPGVFLSPDSMLTDLLIERAVLRDGPVPATDVVVRVPVDPGELFEGLPQGNLVATLARTDRLPVSPRTSLLAAVYYLRLACACFYFWDEQTKPLFGPLDGGADPEVGLIAAEVSRRVVQSSSAFGVLVGWHRDLRDVTMARRSISDAVTLPVGIAEVRERVERSPAPDARASVRRIRRDLDLLYRQALLERVGVIQPDDPRPLSRILKDVRAASKDLRADMLAQLERLADLAGRSHH